MAAGKASVSSSSGASRALLFFSLLAALGLLFLIDAGAPSSPPTPVAPFQSTNRRYCTDVKLLFSGAWEIRRSFGGLQLGPWRPSQQECAGAPNALLPLTPLQGRRVALVGDSVSRFVFLDLAVALFSCGGLAWDGAACGGAPAAASAVCAALLVFACTGRKHESLSLSDGRTTLDFVWAPFAEQLHHGAFKALLADPPHALLVSLGFWDVSVKSMGADKSVAHHCAWMSHAKELVRDAVAVTPKLARALRFWQPPGTEPRGGNDKRIPWAAMEVVDGCSADGFGALFVNTSALLRVPASVFAELASWAAADPLGGALLTAEGFHPRREARAVLLNGFLLHFTAVWGGGRAVLGTGEEGV
jgi:hypothetical protein